jgi:transcriptional regulator with XRE-family HTH domain
VIKVKAARDLLGWNQQDLADRIGASYGTIRRLESKAKNTPDATFARVRAAFEAAGVEFAKGGQPGVRMKATR